MDKAFRQGVLRGLMLGPGVTCPVCLGQASGRDDLHHVLVKRSAVVPDKQELIHVKQNLLFCHHQCHMERGQSRDTKLNGLGLLCQAWGSEAIGRWYAGLWQHHGIHVPKGMLVPKRGYPVWQALRYFDVGLAFCKMDMVGANDPSWNVDSANKKNFLAMCGKYWWQGVKSAKMRPPDQWNGAHRVQVVNMMNEGYWLEYLVGVFGTEIERISVRR